MHQINLPREQNTADLPRFDESTNAGAHEDHPAGVFVVVNQVQQHHNLHENIGNNLPKMNLSSQDVHENTRTVLWNRALSFDCPQQETFKSHT